MNRSRVLLCAGALVLAAVANVHSDPGQHQADTEISVAAESFDELLRRAEAGEAPAQSAVGVRYRWGIDVPANQREAARWFKLAAEQGLLLPQMWLGNMYYTGDGVQQSEAEAARWYRLAADQGYPEAQHRLGLILSRGREGILQDHQSALELFRAAAAQGDGPAQHSLSRMYSEGLAVPADPLQAYVWANLAVHSGNLLAADHRDQVAQRLTPAQLLNAQAISRRCLETDYREC